MDTPRGQQTLIKQLTQITSAGFAIVVILLGGLALQQNSLLGDFETLYKDNVTQERDSALMRHHFKVQVQEWKNVLLRGHDDGNRDKYWGKFQKREQAIQELGKNLKVTLKDNPEALTKLNEFLDSHDVMARKYREGYNAFVNSGYNHKEGDRAVKGIDRTPTKSLDQLIEIINQQTTDAAGNIIGASKESVTVLSPLAFLVTLASIFGLVWFLRKNIAEPLGFLLKQLGAFSSGDFSGSIELKGKGEILALNQGLSSMQKNMRSIMQQLTQASNTLKSTSSQFNQNVESVTQQFSDVQSRADLVATATHQMSSASHEISQSAQGAADASSSADDSAQEGIRVMTQTIDSINQLAHDVEEVTTTMNQLEEATTSIGSVLDVIKGIAEQTNLLALNAAIEAARAGEQGRGFAVVADEVRTLAQRTQESTEEIQTIIETVQSGASNAVNAMRKGRDQTQDCVHLAENAGVSIHSITDAVESIKGMNTQIAAAAEEQNAVSDDISLNIQNVANLSMDTQKNIEQNRELAKEMDSMASSLTEITARFKL